MANLGTLTLDLVAKTGNFVAGLSKAERASKKFADKTKRNAKIAAGAFTALTAATSVATLAMVNTYRKAVDENAKAAKQIEASYSSYATLKQATGDAGVSMSVLMSASRTVNREIGKAIAGNEKAAASFSRIGLSAKELADLPLDQRIGKINEALDKNVHANQRAAASADIFGSRNGQAMAQMNPDIINDAADALDVFGLRLSDVDAAKVEQANSAFSNFGLMIDGVGTQLTVALAPAIKAVSDLFFDTAKEAGGLGEIVPNAVDKAVRALGFAIDVVDGAKRTFVLFTGGAAAGLSWIVKGIVDLQIRMQELVRMVPGIGKIVETPLAALKVVSQGAQDVIDYNMERIDKALNEPLAGGKMLEFYEQAKVAGEEAAQAAVKDAAARREQGEIYEKAAVSVAKATKAQRDATAETIQRLSLEAATLGMSNRERALYVARLEGATAAQLAQLDALHKTIDAYNDTEEAAKKYARLVEDLRTEEERRTDTLREQLAIIKASGASSAEQAEQAARAARAAMDTVAPSYGGADTDMGELARQNEAELELRDWYATQLDMLNQHRQEFAEQSEEWDELELEARRRFNAEMEAIDKARQDVMLKTTSEMFGSAASAAKQFMGESSGIYRALFAMEKTISIARSMLAVKTGIAMAAANPWPKNLAAMASVAAATSGIVSDIHAVGMAHDGIDEIPKTGTWILEKGERVMTENTSAKLDRTLDDVKSGKGGGGVVVNLYEDADKAGQVERSTVDEQTVISMFVSNLLSDGQAAGAIETKYDLATVGR